MTNPNVLSRIPGAPLPDTQVSFNELEALRLYSGEVNTLYNDASKRVGEVHGVRVLRTFARRVRVHRMAANEAYNALRAVRQGNDVREPFEKALRALSTYLHNLRYHEARAHLDNIPDVAPDEETSA